jgi:hypothetical protein
MKPNVRDALAVVHLIHTIPKGLHMATWLAVNEATVLEPYYSKLLDMELHRRRVMGSLVQEVERAPRIVGVRGFEAMGFTLCAWQHGSRFAGRDSIKLTHGDGREAYVTRWGYSWIWERIPGAGHRTIRYDVKGGQLVEYVPTH